MKIRSKIYATALLGGLLFSTACTDNFEELNTDPNNPTVLSNIGPLLTHAQQNIYAPSRFVTWRENVIFSSRFAEHWSFGFTGSWFGNGTGFQGSQGYHDGVWDDSFGLKNAISNNNIGDVTELLRLTGEGGQLENEADYAVALIMRVMLLQKIADNYGSIPYTDAGSGDPTPAFQPLDEVYSLMIQDLDKAMTLIGSATDSGLGNADQVYQGDYQKWKKLANTEKLRIAMRTRNAPGNSFSATAIAEAVSAPLLASNEDNMVIERDPNLEALLQGFANVWTFGPPAYWVMSKLLVEHLDGTTLGTADPRLQKFAQPAEASGNYVGQEVALNSTTPLVTDYTNFSLPAAEIYQSSPVQFPSLPFNYAEAEFLQAEAALFGLGGSDANGHFQSGIRASMEQWGVDEADIATFLASPAATLSGSQEEQLEQIATQRWISVYTYGTEAWAIVRRTGYPVIAPKTDLDKFADTSGWADNELPQRLKYSTNEKALNEANVQAAIDQQGPDQLTTKLWWAK